MMQSGESRFDMNELLQEAHTRWLKPPEVLCILQNHENFRISQHTLQKPLSGSLFLFNRKTLRFFRKDGHNWRKKKDGRNVGEAHERLKVGSAEALNCYYAHGEDNPNFQRRSYWMLDPAYEHIVLVHYRDITQGRSSSGFSSGSYSALSQNPSAYSIQNPDSSSLTGFHGSCQSHCSPGSTEVSSNAVIGKDIDYFNHSNGTDNVRVSSGIDVSEALRRLEVQLSLDDDILKDYAPLDNQIKYEEEYGLADDLSYSNYSGVSSNNNGLSTEESAFDLGIGEGTDSHIEASSGYTYTGNLELPRISLETSLGPHKDSSLTLAKEQRFHICEVSPEWGFSRDCTKVIIVGSFLCDPADCVWHCMFGDIEVPLQIIKDGVLCCKAPPHPPGKVTLCVTAGNRERCSEIREFEFCDKGSTCLHCDKLGGDMTKSTEELLLLVRFVQMLLSSESFQPGENNELGADVSKKKNSDEYSWGQIIESLLVGGGTTSSTLDWLLQQLLKDKLQRWLSLRSLNLNNADCSMSKKEQGMIHMIAGLGYEWALNPILGCKVGVNFRDINGWTALHWAARFGREKMVAALIASGASAVALTDPSAQDPVGRMPSYIAAANGHKGLAAYLSELALTSHLSSLKPELNDLSGYADIEAEVAIKNIPKEVYSSTEDQISLKHTLGAFRNAAQAAARIQAAFRAHSFRKRQQTEAAATSIDDYGFTPNDIHGLSAASKLAFRNFYDPNKAALSIQKNYRSWKGRKEFLTLRQKVVKIQAHVRGFQVRKKHICWAVGILDKAVLRWRRKGAGLRGYKPESESISDDETDDDIVKVYRKERVNTAINEAVSIVRSMMDSPEARQQYNRMHGKYLEAKAELQDSSNQEARTVSESGFYDIDEMAISSSSYDSLGRSF